MAECQDRNNTRADSHMDCRQRRGLGPPINLDTATFARTRDRNTVAKKLRELPKSLRTAPVILFDIQKVQKTKGQKGSSSRRSSNPTPWAEESLVHIVEAHNARNRYYLNPAKPFNRNLRQLSI
ncbi:hypothetical protein N7G274_003893 [Stereocaulon virgatum]|uniref:Uncharacterized protein n=1 Tax=Stereocaulon virgatum TaxID=373712 RepID=A0ABR4ADM6_9LECA